MLYPRCRSTIEEGEAQRSRPLADGPTDTPSNQVHQNQHMSLCKEWDMYRIECIIPIVNHHFLHLNCHTWGVKAPFWDSKFLYGIVCASQNIKPACNHQPLQPTIIYQKVYPHFGGQINSHGENAYCWLLVRYSHNIKIIYYITLNYMVTIPL